MKSVKRKLNDMDHMQQAMLCVWLSRRISELNRGVVAWPASSIRKLRGWDYRPVFRSTLDVMMLSAVAELREEVALGVADSLRHLCFNKRLTRYPDPSRVRIHTEPAPEPYPKAFFVFEVQCGPSGIAPFVTRRRRTPLKNSTTLDNSEESDGR
jgi:hypothetical protein